LIFPPLLRFPVPFVHNVVVRLIVMQGHFIGLNISYWNIPTD
jgi:hypothetical protein